MKEKSAGAIIYRKENGKKLYLLLHYGTGHWDYVKGHVEDKESDRDTIVREAKEETGLTDLKFVAGFKEKIKYFFTNKGKRIEKEVIFLLAETKTERIKLSFEHSDSVWMEFEEAVRKVTYDNGRDVLKKADKFLKKHQKV